MHFYRWRRELQPTANPGTAIKLAYIIIQKMIEVFKTNVQRKTQSKMLLCVLAENFPSSKINFDLSDCDKVLRVEGDHMEADTIMILVREYGFMCEQLD